MSIECFSIKAPKQAGSLILLALGFLTFMAGQPAKALEPAQPAKTIVTLYDGDFAYTRRMSESLYAELEAFASGYYEVNFRPDQSAQWDPQTADLLLKQYLDDPQVDLILVSGPILTEAVKKHLPLPKPVVITSLLDPVFLNMPQTPEGTTGTKNLYYLAKTNSLETDLKLFQSIFNFEKVHLLVEDGLKPYAQGVVDQLRLKNFNADLVSGTGSVDDIVKRLEENHVQALYLTPLNLSKEDHAKLLEAINARKIPTFSSTGTDEVEKGALAGRSLKISLQFSRRIAIIVDRIFKGEDPGTIPIAFDVESNMVVNQKTANLIGLSLPFDILMNAEVLNSDYVHGSKLTMQQAVDAALANNVNFKVLDERIKAVGKDYWLAWSNYLPLAEAHLDYYKSDFSEARYGTQIPDKSVDNGISLNQLIFSHPVLRQISNAKMQVSIEELNRNTAVLDITNQTIVTYLDYLRAKALMKIEQERLKAVSENLSVAARREATGVAGKEEVLRWKAEVANEKSQVLFRDSSIFQTRVRLNQLMNRHQEEVFDEQEVGLETLNYYIGSKSLQPYVTNMDTLRVFLDFSVKEAVKNAPELQALAFGVKQQKNNIKSADGRFILPEVSLDGNVNHNLDEEFSGATPPGDNDGWEVGVKVTYPLFDRGRRPLDSMKQRDILNQLEYSTHLKQQQIELSLRLSAYDIYNSLPSIELKREAMISSAGEYEIMKTKYKEGLISYVDLINIQAVKFQRESEAVIAMYDFFDNLSRFDRQLARFYMLESEPERLKWLTETSKYLESQGITLNE